MNIFNGYMDTNIKTFKLEDYKALFYDIFYKDGKIYIISPKYKDPFDEIDMYINIFQQMSNLQSPLNISKCYIKK